MALPSLPQAPAAVCNSWPSVPWQTLFTPPELPAHDATDQALRAIGVVLSSPTGGTLRAIRFFKAQRENGDNLIGRVYDNQGTQVAQTTPFSHAACLDAWVLVPLSQPLALPPNTSYTVVMDNVGHYVATDGYYASRVARGSLRVPANGGVIGPAGTRPTTVVQSRTYFVDGE